MFPIKGVTQIRGRFINMEGSRVAPDSGVMEAIYSGSDRDYDSEKTQLIETGEDRESDFISV